jgi:hypothetical protein
MDKAKGKAKEAFGAITGDEALKAEGRAEQRKAEAEYEALGRGRRPGEPRPRPGGPRGSATGRGSTTSGLWAPSRARPGGRPYGQADRPLGRGRYRVANDDGARRGILLVEKPGDPFSWAERR